MVQLFARFISCYRDKSLTSVDFLVFLDSTNTCFFLVLQALVHIRLCHLGVLQVQAPVKKSNNAIQLLSLREEWEVIWSSAEEGDRTTTLLPLGPSTHHIPTLAHPSASPLATAGPCQTKQQCFRWR